MWAARRPSRKAMRLLRDAAHMSVNALKWAALLSCAAAYVAWRGMPETEYTSEDC